MKTQMLCKINEHVLLLDSMWGKVCGLVPWHSEGVRYIKLLIFSASLMSLLFLDGDGG